MSAPTEEVVLDVWAEGGPNLGLVSNQSSGVSFARFCGGWSLFSGRFYVTFQVLFPFIHGFRF